MYFNVQQIYDNDVQSCSTSTICSEFLFLVTMTAPLFFCWFAKIQETTFSFPKFWAVPWRFRVPVLSVNHFVSKQFQKWKYGNGDGTGNEKSFPLSLLCLHPLFVWGHLWMFSKDFPEQYCLRRVMAWIFLEFLAIFWIGLFLMTFCKFGFFQTPWPLPPLSYSYALSLMLLCHKNINPLPPLCVMSLIYDPFALY